MRDLILEITKDTVTTMGFTPVEIRIGNGKGLKKLTVVIYRPGSDISMEDCSKLSNVLIRRLELESAGFSENYDLVVESPGVERKLTSLEELLIFQDRLIRFILKNPKDYHLNDNVVVGKVIENDTKKNFLSVETDDGSVAFSWKDVSSAKLYFDIKKYL